MRNKPLIETKPTRPWHRLARAIGGMCLAAMLLGSGWVALAQDQSAATAKDAILARKTLMDFISDAMDEIEAMTASGKINLSAGTKRADQISAMFQAFPHIFPASTNQWKPNVEMDPETGTAASPDVWTKFPDFYQRASAASKIAFEISRAEKEADFKARVQELRTACDSCHALYMKQ
jgi:cytochrome c556